MNPLFLTVVSTGLLSDLVRRINISPGFDQPLIKELLIDKYSILLILLKIFCVTVVLINLRRSFQYFPKLNKFQFLSRVYPAEILISPDYEFLSLVYRLISDPIEIFHHFAPRFSLYFILLKLSTFLSDFHYLSLFYTDSTSTKYKTFSSSFFFGNSSHDIC